MGEAVSVRFEEFVKFTAREPWRLVVKPFRVAPNVYYIGNEWVGAYLIDTEEGLILLDTCVFENVYLTLDSIRELGFDYKKIKHIMLTHCHIDHVGGARAIQELTGAKIWLSKADADFMHHKANLEISLDFQCHSYNVDYYYDDNTLMQFGSVQIRTLQTPGHTPGTTSFFISSPDENGDNLTLGMHGGVGPITMTDDYYNKYNLPNLRKRFIEDCEILKLIHVDIAMPSHPAHGALFTRRTENNMDYHSFVDTTLWTNFLDTRSKFVKDLDK